MTTPADRVLPALQPVLQVAAVAPALDFGDLALLREQSDQQVETFSALYVPDAPTVTTSAITVPVAGADIGVRIHRPAHTQAAPVLVYLHGGGWILGSAKQTDRICRRLADRLGFVVASVDYRLAPGHPFPGPVEDGYAALEWIAAHAAELGGDPSALVIGGQSAGGNLAAGVALMCRDKGGPAIRLQWLDVPALDLTLPPDESLTDFGDGFGLNVADVRRTIALYVRDEDREHPYASPLLAPSLADLPPAVITVAGCDPLRDQGVRYAAALAAAGVPARLTQWDGHLHATMSLTNLDPSNAAYEDELVDAFAAVRASA